MKSVLPLMVALLAPTAALAQSRCDYYADKAATETGASLVAALNDLAQCDPKQLDSAFPTFMRAAGDAETLVALGQVAIDAKQYTPVWNMLEGLKEYSQRTAVSKGVGEGCIAHPNTVQFLQGAYFGLRDIQFVAWDDALVACTDPALIEWMRGLVSKPPSSSYDEKYAAIVDSYVKHMGPASLPVLQRAAIAASTTGGPFTAIIEKMDQAVQPARFGDPIADADRAALEAALIAVANEVGPSQAALVADRLFNVGSEEAAASLLRRVYPDRVTSAGRLLYGAAAIESCDQQAVVHYALVMEPAKRWSILADVEAPLRAFKGRLGCTPEGQWPIVATTAPIEDEAALSRWAEGQVKQWADQGYDAKSRREKDVILP